MTSTNAATVLDDASSTSSSEPLAFPPLVERRTRRELAPVAPETSLERGSTVLGKYEVERLLGEGGMGVVLAVRHVELGELFAMKLLRPSVLKKHASAAERFLNEARAAAQLRSDHVVRVYDVGHLDGRTPYMMMEHLEGRDLSNALLEDGPFAALDVVEYMLQALDAVAEAHTLGVVHRDLKPENLFLASRANGKPTLKVLDFGISKQIDAPTRDGESQAEREEPVAPKESGARAKRLTGTSTMVGSPCYMPPEQIVDSRNVDARGDVWALGVIMYELLTGNVPFGGFTVAQVCAEILTRDMIPIRTAAPAVPEELAKVIDTCLSTYPRDRFQTAEELGCALTQVRVAIEARELAIAPARQSDPVIVFDESDDIEVELEEPAALAADDAIPLKTLKRASTPAMSKPKAEKATRKATPRKTGVEKPRRRSSVAASLFVVAAMTAAVVSCWTVLDRRSASTAAASIREWAFPVAAAPGPEAVRPEAARPAADQTPRAE